MEGNSDSDECENSIPAHKAVMVIPYRSASAIVWSSSRRIVLPASIARTRPPDFPHGLDGGSSDRGNVECMSCSGLATLTTTNPLPRQSSPARLMATVRPSNGLHREDGALANHHALADVETPHLLGQLPAVSDVALFGGGRFSLGQDAGIHEQLRAEFEGRGTDEAISGKFVDEGQCNGVVAIVARVYESTRRESSANPAAASTSEMARTC